MTGSALSANQDQVLEDFIALVRQKPDLKAQIKAALNQDQVIDIAAANGFDIDSSAILRKWSKHTDFSQDTWMGWFEEWLLIQELISEYLVVLLPFFAQ